MKLLTNSKKSTGTIIARAVYIHCTVINIRDTCTYRQVPQPVIILWFNTEVFPCTTAVAVLYGINGTHTCTTLNGKDKIILST